MTQLVKIAAVLLLALAALPARAETYPWLEIGRDDLRHTSDARVETVLREALIGGATRTIDLVVYDLRFDGTVALPLLARLREAADRGVQVRLITAWFPQLMKDPRRKATDYLLNPPTRTPIQVVIAGGGPMRREGWRIDDGIHDKLLLVDGRIALLSGRGFSDAYLDWEDTAFLFKGALIAQAADAFARLWSTVLAVNPRQRARHAAPFAPPARRPVVLDEAGAKQVAGLLAWSDAPSGKGGFTRARLLHHDFLRQLGALNPRPRALGLDERARRLDDPVIDAIAARLGTAHEARLQADSTVFTPRLESALLGALRRGVRLSLVVDGKSAYRVVLPIPMPWFVGLPDMESLLAAGGRVYAFEKAPGAVYLHRKAEIFDDAVIFGSHKLTVPSTVTSDELDVEVEDADFAAELAGEFDRTVLRQGIPMELAAVRHERKTSGFRRWIYRIFEGVF